MGSLAKSLVGAARMPGIAWSFSRIGFERRARSFDPVDDRASLLGKHLAVTGGNSGIGYAIATAWAKRDANVWLMCRNRERGEAARQSLTGLGKGEIHLETVDVADLASIDALLARIDLPQLDALVHNAGALVHERTNTAHGLELTFACHVVGPQRLNHGLQQALERATDPRVIYVASGGMYSERLNVDELVNPPNPFDGVRAYALAKRAQVTLAELWAARSSHVKYYAMHPGWVDTPGVSDALPRFYRTTRRWLRTTEQGADTAVWLSSAAHLALPSGEFVFDRQAANRYILPGTRADAAERNKLWDAVEVSAEVGP